MKNTFLGKNLELLRKVLSLNQAQMAASIGFERTTYVGWERNKSLPKVEDLIKIAEYFDINEGLLLHSDLSNVQNGNEWPTSKKGQSVQDHVQNSVQIASISRDISPGIHQGMPAVVTVDTSGRDNVVYVPVKARAGYLLGYGDGEFIKSLPAYSVPGLTHGTYRAFEVAGNSMFNTLHDHDTVIGRWATDGDFRDDRVFIIVTKNDGILVKRCIFREGKIIAKSDNNHKGDYPTTVLELSEVAEIWYVVQRWTRQLSQPGEIFRRVIDLESKMALLENRLNGG